MGKQIFLTGIVSEWTAEDVRYMLTNSSEKQIDIYISSWGGSVNKGLEIANLIQGIQATGKKDIHTFNLSHADSIATAIFLAPPKENRHVVENSTFFVHEPRFIVFDEVTQNDAEKMKAELQMQTNRLADFYVKNIEGLEKEEALSLMNAETNLTAEKMLELNIVSEIKQEFEIAAQRNLISNLNNDKMSLFNSKKQEVVNTLSLEDGSIVAFNGDLKEGTEVAKVGEVVNLEGSHVDSEGRTIVVDANNKVTEIKAKEEPQASVEGETLTAKEVAEIVAEEVEKVRAEMQKEINAIKTTGSTGKPEKVEPTNQKVNGDARIEAKKKVQAELASIQAKKRKDAE